MTITLSSSGSFKNTNRFLQRMKSRQLFKSLSRYGDQGVRALSAATPSETGATAQSWSYEISMDSRSVQITWSNSNSNKGVPIAILIQYGHGTGTGGYVPATNFINPAIKPVFDDILNSVWKEVTSS